MALGAGSFLDGYKLRLPGTNGNYASTPDSAALSITGDLDICVRCAATDWTPAAIGRLVSKWTSAVANASYVFTLNTNGSLTLSLNDGTSAPNTTSSVSVGFTDGTTRWVRATWRSSDDRVQFFTSDTDTNDPAAAVWTQLGTDQAAAITTIQDNASPLVIGSLTGTSQLFIGSIYRVQIRDGIDGTVVFDADFSQPFAGDNAFTESSANAATVTINSTDAASFFTVAISQTEVEVGGDLAIDDMDSIATADDSWFVGGVECTFVEVGDGRLVTLDPEIGPQEDAVVSFIHSSLGEFRVGTVDVIAAPSGGLGRRTGLGLGIGLF